MSAAIQQRASAETVVDSEALPTFRLTDVVGFLFGSQSSIERLIATPRAIFFAASLVCTAALAREYDAVSFVHQPMDLLAPFAASLFVSVILFLFVEASCYARKHFPFERSWGSYVKRYGVFLTGYWMTAPLAWLYAVPVEVLTDEISALRFNLAALSIVSLWRVALFARFVSVYYRVPFIGSLIWILLPCMAIAFFALLNRVLSLVSLMGGLRLTQTQQILHNFNETVLGGIFYGFIPVAVLWIVSLVIIGKRDQDNQSDETNSNLRTSRLHSLVWLVPLLFLVIIVPAAIYFQPRLYRAANVDSLLGQGHVDAAIDAMQSYGQDAFLTVWDPMPKFPERDSNSPMIKALVDAIKRKQPEAWIRNKLLVRADEIAMRQFGYWQGTHEREYVVRNLSYYKENQLRELEGVLAELETLQVNAPDVARVIELRDFVQEAIEAAIVRQTAKESEEQSAELMSHE